MRTLFTVACAVELLFGIGFMTAPTVLVSLFGATLGDFGGLLGRMLGTALVGFAVLLWIGRQSSSRETRWAVLVSVSTYWVLSAFFLLLGQLSGVMNVMGWGAFGIHLVLATAAGFCLLAESEQIE